VSFEATRRRAALDRAVAIARDTDGVRGVHSSLVVRGDD
jgi:hypothetical protein